MGANQETRLSTEEFDWSNKPILETFKTAANAFVKRVNGNIQIWAASRDWFMEEWGRDTFVSLPGLLLVHGKYKEAKLVFKRFAKLQNNGLIPNIIAERVEYNSADASLWFIQALKSYLKYTKDLEFVKDMLPVMRRIVGAYKNRVSYVRCSEKQTIFMDSDGLIVNPKQGTWMDADCFGKAEPITPRDGKAVEINALWYDSLRFMSKLDNEYGFLADSVKKSFVKKFWSKSNYLYDVIDGDPHGRALRPNMIFAVRTDLLSKARQKQIVKKVEEKLLTPGGLRTLSPNNPNYHGTYDTYLPIEQKDLAYHQGSAWPWLIGGYCDVLAKIGREKDIKKVITPLVRFCLESKYKSLPELFSGDPPYEPGGTTSQAWSVAEVLRILVEYSLV